MLCPCSFLGRMSRPLQILKHPQFREVGAFASLTPISQKSEMSSSRDSRASASSFTKGKRKLPRGKGDLGDHSRSLLGGAPRKRSIANGRKMGMERLAGLTADMGPLSREASGFLAISFPDDGDFLGSACRS